MTTPTRATWEPGVTAGAPWTKGPWTTGAPPDGHCRIYAPGETHAIARTYGPNLNGIGICQLTGPQNIADAALISEAPILAEIAARLIAWEAEAGGHIPKTPGAWHLLVALNLAKNSIDRVIESCGLGVKP